MLDRRAARQGTVLDQADGGELELKCLMNVGKSANICLMSMTQLRGTKNA